MTLSPCWRVYRDHPGDDGTVTDEEEREEAARFWDGDLRGTPDDEEADPDDELWDQWSDTGFPCGY